MTNPHAVDYTRVLPRDLFNEAKLLKCFGQLSLLIHDGMLPEGVELVHRRKHLNGFAVLQDGIRGHFFIRNLKLRARQRWFHLAIPINSRSPYPLVLVTKEECEIEVFHDDGSLTEDFKNYIDHCMKG